VTEEQKLENAAKQYGLEWGTKPDYQERRDKTLRKYAAAMGHSLSGNLLKALRAGSEFVEHELVGGVAKKGEQMGLWQLAWDDPMHRQFRYHNAGLFRDEAAAVYSLGKAIAEQPDQIVAGGFGAVSPAILKRASDIYKNEGQRWAKDHPDLVDALVSLPFDPLMHASEIVTAAKAANKAAQIERLLPIAKAVRAAGNDTDAVLALSKTEGGELTGTIRNAVSQMNTEQDAAKFLYEMQYRAKGLVPRIPVPRFFRRATEFYGRDNREIAERSLQIVNAIKKNYASALEAAETALGRRFTKDELATVQKLWNIVPRDPEMPRQSFHLNFERLMLGDTLEVWDPVAKAKVPVRWDGPWPSMEVYNAAENGADILAGGWRPGQPYLANYGPGAQQAMREAGEAFSADERAAPEVIKAKDKPFLNAREQAAAVLDSRAEVRKFLAEVSTRNLRIDQVNEFGELAKGRIAEYEQALAKTSDAATKARLQENIESLNKMHAAVSEWKTTDGAIKAVRRSDNIGGMALRAWDSMVDFQKKWQLGAVPSWAVKNLIDSRFVRNALTVGRVDLAKAGDFLTGPAPLRGIMGDVLEVGTTMARDISGAEPDASVISRLMDNAEEGARGVAYRQVYHEKAAEFINGGMSHEAADTAAKTLAKRATDEIHVGYDNLSMFDHIAKRILPYEVYNTRTAGLYAKLAIGNPTEAYTLMRASEAQHEYLSVDRQGNMTIPGTNWAHDPASLTSFNQLLQAAVNPSQNLDWRDADRYKPVKAMELVTGSAVPVIDKGLRLADLKPEVRDPSYGQVDRVIENITASLTGKRVNLSHEAGRLLGIPGEEDPELAYDYRLKHFMAAAELNGTPLSVDVAKQRMNQMDAITNFWAYTAGLKLSPNTPGDRRINEIKSAYKQAISELPAHMEPNSREQFLQAYPFVRDLLPAPRIPTYDNKLQQIDREQKANDQTSTDTEQRFGNIAEAIKSSTVGQLAGKAIDALTPAASAEEQKPQPQMTQDPNNGGLPPPPDATFAVVGGKIKAVVVDPAKATPQQLQDNYYHNSYISDFQTKLATANKPSDIKAIVDKDPVLFRNLKQYAGTNEQVRSAFDLYTAMTTPGQGRYEAETFAIHAKRQQYQQAYEGWVFDGLRSGGLGEAKRRINAPIEQVRAGVTPFLGVGQKADDLDSVDTTVMGRKITDTRLGIQAKQVLHEKPVDSDALGDLRNAVASHSSTFFNEELQRVDDKIRNGQLSPDFWNRLAIGDHQLASHLALRSGLEDVQKYKNVATIGSFSGRASLSPAIVAHYLETDRARAFPAYAALAQNLYGDDQAQATLAAGAKKFPIIAELFNTSPHDVAAHYAETFYEDRTIPQPKGTAMDAEGHSGPRLDFGTQDGPEPLLVTGRGPAPLPPFTPIEKAASTAVTQQIKTPNETAGTISRASFGPAPAPVPILAQPIDLSFARSIVKPAFNVQVEPIKAPPNGFQFRGIGDFIGTAMRETSRYNAAIDQARKLDDNFDAPKVNIFTTAGILAHTESYHADASGVAGAAAGLSQSAQGIASSVGGNATIQPYQYASAVSGLLNLSEQLGAFSPESTAGHVTSGLGTALSTYFALGGPATGPGQAITIPIAATVGILQGLGIFGKKKNNNAELERQRAAEAARAAQIAEQQRQQSIRSLVANSQALSDQYHQANHQQIRDEIQQFRVRPQFSSNQGLVNQAERDAAQALRPRY
jgi:hypothetical protein